MSSCTTGCTTKSILEQFPDKTRELREFLDSIVVTGDMDKNRGYLIKCLHKAQSIFGYLPLEVQQMVGKRLRIQQSDIYGVISFYSFFTDKPVGKHIVNICTGTACFVKGADKIVAEFKDQLGISVGETTPDGMFSLVSLRCIGACSLAPVVMVNDKVYGKVEPKKVKQILNEYK